MSRRATLGPRGAVLDRRAPRPREARRPRPIPARGPTLRALALSLLAAVPALALAQAEGATGDPTTPLDQRPGGFRPAPTGPDGELLEYVPPAPPKPELAPAAMARLRLLDKMTGEVTTVDMRPGETRWLARLEVSLGACMTPVTDARREAVAWLEIRDAREETPRFRGWMFSTSPALSALDHARYDVWVLSCGAEPEEG